jgi:hypothetical protein
MLKVTIVRELPASMLLLASPVTTRVSVSAGQYSRMVAMPRKAAKIVVMARMIIRNDFRIFFSMG